MGKTDFVWRRRASNCGMTLAEVIVAVAILGVLAALANQGVRRYLNSAKSAEARQTVGAISRAVQAAATREEGVSAGSDHKVFICHNGHTIHVDYHAVPAFEAMGSTIGVCGGSPPCLTTPPVPDILTKVAGRKYQPILSAGQDYQEANWMCLRFQISQPQYYQYRFTASECPFGAAPSGGGKPPAKGPPASTSGHWCSYARGDLDGDAIVSWLTLHGTMTPDGEVKIDTAMGLIDPEE